MDSQDIFRNLSFHSLSNKETSPLSQSFLFNLTRNNSSGNTSDDLALENQRLKDQIKSLSNIITQYECTGHRAMAENALLQSKALTYEIEIKCLVEALEVQAHEIQKRDAVIFKLVEEVNEHNEKIELISKKAEEKGSPECKICCRNTDILTRCDNHAEDDSIVGCVFCSLNKCPMCRSTDVYHTILGKKIAKIPRNKKNSSTKKKSR